MLLKPRRRPIRKTMVVLAANTGIAFVHDDAEQHAFSEADIPPEIMSMMTHVHDKPGGGAAAHGEELGHEQPSQGGAETHGEEPEHKHGGNEGVHSQ